MEHIRNSLNEEKKRKFWIWGSIILICVILLIWFSTEEWIPVVIALIVGILAIIILSKRTPFISPQDVHKKTQEQDTL